jgi:hypothetical protein
MNYAILKYNRMNNNKTGFIYYSLDTDRYQDIRIKRLKRNFSCAGIAIYDYVLCEIYRVKGCFIVWDENTAFDVADYFAIKESLVKEVIDYCCVVGLFNKELLDSESVLTSAAIQKRFVEWSKKAKRVRIEIPENIFLLDDLSKLPEDKANLPEDTDKLPELSPDIPEEPPNNSGRFSQSKVKESKVNNPPTPLAGGKPSIRENSVDYEKLVSLYHQKCPDMPAVKTLNTSRKRAVNARVKEHGKLLVLEALELAGKSPFLNGDNDRNWKANFDWIFNPTNFAKILDGCYPEKAEKEEKLTYKPKP